MLTAIFVIVVMATIAAFILNLSGKMVKETTTQYQKEQAMLLAKSYTEFAIMAVTANDQNSSNCLNNISGSYGDYNIDVNISYIGRDTILNTNCRNLYRGTINTLKSPLNIIIDVFVHYPDYDHPNNLKLSYHRRSLQKI
jgi:hypothetical protein